MVFRSTALGDGYGQVAVVPLADPDGPRAFTPAACERVYATGRRRASACPPTAGIATTYKAQMLGPRLDADAATCR